MHEAAQTNNNKSAWKCIAELFVTVMELQVAFAFFLLL